ADPAAQPARDRRRGVGHDDDLPGRPSLPVGVARPLAVGTECPFGAFGLRLSGNWDCFLVVERDQGIGAEAALKAVYALDLSDLVPDADGRPGEAGGSDVARKVLVADVAS